MAELRKMTMGEVAEVAGDPKETIRTRMNRFLGEREKAPGWARLDVPSTVQIAVQAEVLRMTGAQGIALLAANFAAESIANFLNYPPHTIKRKGQLAGNHLIFRRSAIDPTQWKEHWCKSDEEAARMAGEFIAATAETTWGGFYFLNVSTVTDWAIDRIFDLQEIDGNVAGVTA